MPLDFYSETASPTSDEVASHSPISLTASVSVLSLSPSDTIHKKYPSLVSFYPLSLTQSCPGLSISAWSSLLLFL